MDFCDLEKIKDIERDLLISLILGVKHSRITLAEAKEAAGEFLEEDPCQMDMVIKKLLILSRRHKDIRKVYLKFGSEFSEKRRLEMLDSVRFYMKFGKYDKALKVIKGEI